MNDQLFRPLELPPPDPSGHPCEWCGEPATVARPLIKRSEHDPKLFVDTGMRVYACAACEHIYELRLRTQPPQQQGDDRVREALDGAALALEVAADELYSADWNAGESGAVAEEAAKAARGALALPSTPAPVEEEGVYELLAHFRDERARLTRALQRLQMGPDTLTQDGLRIVLDALYPDNSEKEQEAMVTEQAQAARLREIADDLWADQRVYAAKAKKKGDGRDDFERGCALAFGIAADRLEGEIAEVLYA